MAVMGQFDQNVRLIEERLSVRVLLRDSAVSVTGEEFMADSAIRVFARLGEMAEGGGEITRQSLIHMLGLAAENRLDELPGRADRSICTTYRGKQIKAKTLGQQQYIDAITGNTVTFCIGPAGTGKTYLAVAMAVTAFKNRVAERIVLTRPAVEAGEKLGFLPGDMQNKVDPYLRPLYDALYDTMGAESYARYFEKGMIEIAPLAYMRGRTLDNSFIILDEAQNTTTEQMKMFLTRIGFGSKVVVTGDVTQMDLPPDKKSGLKEVVKILDGVEDVKFVHLTDRDVVRHELVRKIIKAYEEYERRAAARAESARRRGGAGLARPQRGAAAPRGRRFPPFRG
ncbi:MAG: PhoH family protein [Clostridiales bacterium]|jgi:phosphate starvation-inducible PhoH-like protein|nr:PhoH family protein [Clostridiales bacterium]